MADPATLEAIKSALSDNQKQTAEAMKKGLAAQEKMILTLTTKVERLEGGGGGMERMSSAGASRFAGASGISRSASRKVASTNKEDSGETAVDPVKVGDFLILKAADFGGAYFTGDTASRRVGVQTLDDETSHRTPLKFNDYVFRVCPMLNYRQRNELELLEKSNAKAASEGKAAEKKKGGKKGRAALSRQASAGSALVEQQQVQLLRSRVANEEVLNLATMQLVKQGERAEAVKYGDIVQLQHVTSGCYVSVLEAAAPCDPECRAVVLDERGSSAALFKFMPKFKAQTEGSIVYYSHAAVLESVKQRGMMLHASKIPYSNIPDVSNPGLPKCLQSGKVLEANLSPQSSTFVVSKYARFTPQDAGLLRTSSPFRLYHSQSESFVHASCDAEKDRRWPTGRDTDLPAHVPFLWKLPDNGDDPDATDPKHHKVKGVWCFEPASRRSARTVPWDTVGAVRVRHVASGRYLCVDTDSPQVHEHSGMTETWYPTFLVDDEAMELDDDEGYVRETFTGAESAGAAAASAGAGASSARTFAGNELGFKTALSSKMLFTVTSADATTSATVPDSDVSLRLEHTFLDPSTGAKTSLYFHNSEERKPSLKGASEKGSVIAKSFMTVFSTVRSAQDIFKMMRASGEEERAITDSTSFVTHCRLYAAAVANPSLKLRPAKEKVEGQPEITDFVQTSEIILLMLKVINMQVKGNFTFDKGQDWVKRANGLLPAAFSALFGGEAEPMLQRIARDVKLLDAVFDMGTAAYVRLPPPALPWTDFELEEGPKAVQKFIHVAIQRMCDSCQASQEYFGRRVASAQQGGKPWMDTLLMQLDDPLGAAVTLSKLLSANEGLMKRYASPVLVTRFLEMISNLGPQPRLVNFFEAICTVEGRAVKANQEMVLRLTWMNDGNRSKTYLRTAAIPEPTTPALPQLKPVSLPSGKMTDGKLNRDKAKKFPKSYIGKEVMESDQGLPPVFVQWDGADKWGTGLPELFWSPTSLGLPLYDKGKDKRPEDLWVRVEDLCWVLDKQRLCEAVTGRPWKTVEAEAAADPKGLGAKLKQQTQLADYYVGQLNLNARQCFGRSYNCISWMERSFSYPMLCSMAYNPHLPPRVRAAACNFVQTLYLDRYPQLTSCGKPSLPEQLWVYELTAGSDVDKQALPLIKPLSLSEGGSLVEFAIPASHKLAGDPNPFYGFQTGFKFFMLRNLGNEYVSSFGTGTVVHANSLENQLANQIAGLISALTSFGFQSSLEKIRSLLGPLVKVLDGRSDAKAQEGFDGQGPLVPFDPPSDRFRQTPVSPAVTNLKTTIISILMAVSNLRANFRLGKLLLKFKEYNEDDRYAMELKKMHVCIAENKADRYEGPLTERLFDDFEELFMKGDGAALDLGKLSGDQPIDTIMLDCLMYDDDNLFSAALELLERTYGQRRKLLDALGEVTLLQRESVPVFGNAADMTSELSYLIFLVRSSEVWGVCSRVSGPFNMDKYDTVVRTCDRLCEFLHHEPMNYESAKLKAGATNRNSLLAMRKSITSQGSEVGERNNPLFAGAESPENGPEVGEAGAAGEGLPVPFHQDVLRAMNVQATLIAALAMNYNISFMGSICSSEDKVKSREMLVHSQRKLVEVLVLFVKGNEKNQTAVFQSLNGLRGHLGPLKHPPAWPADFGKEFQDRLPTAPGMNAEEVIIECIRNNAELCQNEVPRDLLEEFGSFMDQERDPSDCDQLELFQIMCQPDGPTGKAIPRNQIMVLDVLLSDRLTNLRACLEAVFFGAEVGGTAGAKPERIVALLSSTICQHNIKAAAKLASRRFTIEATLQSLTARLSTLTGGGMDVEQEEDALADSKMFCALLDYLANQLEVLVIDPKVFRNERTWELVSLGCNRVLGCAVRRQITLSASLAFAAEAACKVANVVVEGARSLGLSEHEERHSGPLRTDANSVFSSAHSVGTSAFFKRKATLRAAAVALAHLIDPTASHGLDEEDDDESEEEEEKADDAAVRRPSATAGSVSAAAAASSPNDGDGWEGGDDDDEEGVSMSEVYSGGRGHRSASLTVLKEAFDPQTAAEKMKKQVVVSEQGIGDMSGVNLNDYVRPAGMRRYFHEALTHNVKVTQKLSARRFEMVKVLENAEHVTGSEGRENHVVGGDGMSAFGITFGQLVDRMVKYVQQHNYDSDEASSLRVFRTLRSYVLRGRSKDDGEEQELPELSEKERAAFGGRQDHLMEKGVVGVVLTAIATHPANQEGNLADEGVELLMELLNGGNVNVQTALKDYVQGPDRDNKLLLHFRARMAASSLVIKERKERVASGEYEMMTKEHRAGFENAAQTFLCLQQLCEGHNLDSQNLLREQAGHASSVNLLFDSTALMIQQCETSLMLKLMEEAEVELLCYTMDLLTEAVQGPCAGNQEQLVFTDGFVACLDKILQSPFDPRVRPSLRLSVKASAVMLISSCLEGRSDLEVHKFLARELEPAMFDMFRQYLTAMLTKTSHLSGVTEEEMEEVESLCLDAMASIKNILSELTMIEEFDAKQNAIIKEKKKTDHDMMDEDIATVEVSWKERIETVTFPTPKECSYLTIKTRDEFLVNADLATNEKRMKELMAQAPIFMAEMEQIYLLSQWSKVYTFIHHNIVNIKWSMYALVVLLNINIVMASYGGDKEFGYRSIYHGLAYGLSDNAYFGSLMISLVLALINLVGYIIIVTFLAVTEVPIIIRQLDDYVEECIDSISMKEQDYRDLGAFTWWTVTLVFNVLFIIMHQYNYPENPNPGLYLFLIFGINLPWTLSCVRNYIVVPNTPQTRFFCVAFDVLVTKPFFRNHVLLMFFSINGFTQSTYFTLMMMDIMNNSRVLANVARSVTDNLVQLGWVFYLFICTVVIYAQFGLEFFEDWFVYDGEADDEEAKGCHSVVSCFFLIFYLAVPAGSMGEVLDNISNRDNQYIARVMFDLSFFVWVGVLLFNIITGLMVDGFGALREEDNDRKDILENSCFVCGFSRTAYDDVPNFRGPTFDFHKDQEHEFWNYVNFYVHLKKKDKNDYSGVESYVWEMISTSDLAWLPVRMCSSIQRANASVENEDEGVSSKAFDKVANDVWDIKQHVAVVNKKVAEMAEM